MPQTLVARIGGAYCQENAMAPIDSSIVPGPGTVWFTAPEADRTIIGLRGEHDASTVASVSDALARAIAVDDTDLVLDLSEVAFIGAATIGVIVRTREFLRPRARSLTLRAPSAVARRVLEICGLTDLVDVAASTQPTGPAVALRTWVAVPAADREPLTDPVPVRAGRIPSTASVDARQASAS